MPGRWREDPTKHAAILTKPTWIDIIFIFWVPRSRLDPETPSVSIMEEWSEVVQIFNIEKGVREFSLFLLSYAQFVNIYD